MENGQDNKYLRQNFDAAFNHNLCHEQVIDQETYLESSSIV
jgi:hypothetical protein